MMMFLLPRKTPLCSWLNVESSIKTLCSLFAYWCLLGGNLAFGQTSYTVSPTVLANLPSSIEETSGLINIDGDVWTHNDSGGNTELYQINTATGAIINTVFISGTTHVDWEDITFDDDYIYIGDFGNNSGSRVDLKIYRINRSAVAAGTSPIAAETINFSFSDQVDFTPSANANDYDCEAIIAFKGKLYLFSKNWVNFKTRLYELDNTPGTHIAQYQETFNSNGMVTGASINPLSNILSLVVYQKADLSPSTLLFYDFPGTQFFNGSHSILNWQAPSTAQIEGVVHSDLYKLYITREKSQFSIFNIPFVFHSQMYELDISPYVTTYNHYDGALELEKTQSFNYDQFTTSTSGMSADKLAASCWTGGVNNNVWFKFQAASADMNVTVLASGIDGTLSNPQMAIWGADGTSEVACKKSVTANGSIYIHTSALIPGNWYYVSVDHPAPADAGSFKLLLREGDILTEVAPILPGSIRYNPYSHHVEGFNGSEWKRFNN